MLEFALSQETARTAPLLPPVEGWEENLLFHFVSVPTSSKKEQFPFPPGSQVHGTTVCDALLPHSRPRPILPVAKRVQFGDDIPPHAPLASPAWDPGSLVRMPQNAPPSVPSTPTPFRCTTTGMSIVPLEPLAQRLETWLTLAGSHAQFDSATRFSSPSNLQSSKAFLRRRWQSGTPLSCARRLLSSWQRMQSSRSLQPRWGRGFTALTSSYPRKVVAFGQSWICESWTGLCTSSRSRCWRTGAWSNAFSPRIGLQRSTWRTLTFTFRSFRWTKMNDSLLVIRKGAVLANESVISNFSTPLKYLQNYVWFVGIGQKMPDGGNGDVMSPCNNLEPSLVARDSASSA